MSINKLNFSTTADGADIFILSTAGESFTNTGNLTTSGRLASPVRVGANGVSVDNKGTLTTSGDGSPGITVGDIFGTHYNNVTVTNHGVISTSGAGVFDTTVAFPDGIDAYGNNNQLLNYGKITATGPDGAGMGVIGVNCLLVNYGTIDAVAGGLIADTIDGTGNENGNTLINYGAIITHGEESYGIVAFTAENVVKNFGSIQGDGFFSYGIGLLGAANYGENRGSILMTGDLDRGIIVEGEGQLFVNYGSIKTTGDGSIGARFSGENPPDSDGGTIINYGTITSAAYAVRGALADDHFINYGKLIGTASMGAGDDSYTAGKGGSLSGPLTLGAGDDLIIFEKGGGSLTVTDFVAGAGTDDVIDVSSFGYTSFGQVMSNATQSGSDVVLKFGQKDVIVLQNVTLAQLHPDDFALASVLGLSAVQSQGYHDLLALA